ncbi:hypothetical protein GUITHDRAFT_116739 [Guillardia theta CCMP2712]|uniref:Uncharacterized protein n=1 Tax=Guillardia theta (strain CCMP2712) TaxID=905079 RepID=L1IM09_GUITC|nr:hypothetical protein GUITHDRAFT_116739 [Guillardia theta CCMP2712]EKX37162.1 hypothetical protein GUITHDRAFT_116739 [Guillardia theta CCMP2712]|eukprot:XP_005824142.1 hypothetical protein GUITHDRAFT_116739 [Guillardia theta CCMP2712]
MNGLDEDEISTVLEMRMEGIARLTEEVRSLEKEYKAVLAASGNLRRELEESRGRNSKLQRVVAKLQQTRHVTERREEGGSAERSILVSSDRILEIFRTSSISIHPRSDDPFLPGRIQDVLTQLVEETRRTEEGHVTAESYEHARSQLRLFREKADQWKSRWVEATSSLRELSVKLAVAEMEKDCWHVKALEEKSALDKLQSSADRFDLRAERIVLSDSTRTALKEQMEMAEYRAAIEKLRAVELEAKLQEVEQDCREAHVKIENLEGTCWRISEEKGRLETLLDEAIATQIDLEAVNARMKKQLESLGLEAQVLRQLHVRE